MIRPEGFPDLPDSFSYETEVLQSTDGEHHIFLNWFKKKRVQQPKRALLIVHGQGEHGARYQHFAHYLQQDYDLIVAPDLRGHGRSEGVRGHVDSFDEYVDDAMLAWETLKSRMMGAGECDWFGHSMGGTVSLLAFKYRADLGAKHLLLSSPALKLAMEVPMFKDIAARVLAPIWGSLTIPTGLNAEKLSHDPAVIKNVKNDQLNHQMATPKFYLGFQGAMESLRENDLQIDANTRVLFQLAGEDEIVSAPVAERFFEKQLLCTHKTIRIYPGLHHEIYNELTKEHVFEDLKNFLAEG